MQEAGWAKHMKNIRFSLSNQIGYIFALSNQIGYIFACQ